MVCLNVGKGEKVNLFSQLDYVRERGQKFLLVLKRYNEFRNDMEGAACLVVGGGVNLGDSLWGIGTMNLSWGSGWVIGGKKNIQFLTLDQAWGLVPS